MPGGSSLTEHNDVRKYKSDLRRKHEIQNTEIKMLVVLTALNLIPTLRYMRQHLDLWES